MVHAGLAVAASPKRALARVYGLLPPALEDTCLSCVLWMPAHKSAAHVGKLRLCNGDLHLFTENDVKANDIADGLAKQTVEVEQWKKDDDHAFHMLKWIGKAVNLACNTEVCPFKDNEASSFKANEAKANKSKLEEDKRKEEERRRAKKETRRRRRA